MPAASLASTLSNPYPPHAILRPGKVMRSAHSIPVCFSRKSWNRAFVRAIAPRRFLRVLPTRTRPSLFGSD